MATTANTTAPLRIAERIARLPELSMDDLWGLWDEHFEVRPAHHHRGWLESRLAYRIQEIALGGLKPATKRKLERIGETGQLPGAMQRDADQLLPGTVLTRTHDGIEHRVHVHGAKAFEYRGQRYKSLSAIARAIAGCAWSGPAFFGLKPARARKEPA